MSGLRSFAAFKLAAFTRYRKSLGQIIARPICAVEAQPFGGPLEVAADDVDEYLRVGRSCIADRTQVSPTAAEGESRYPRIALPVPCP